MFKILFSVIFLFSFNVFSQSTGKVIQADNIQGVDVEKNYIPNGLAENFNVIGWNRYDDGSVARPVDGTGGTADYISIAHTTTSPLEDKGSFLITKTANNARGEGLSIDFKVPRAKRGERQCIFIDYEITSGTFTAGTDTTDSDLIAYIYDKDAAQVIEPANFKFFSIGQDKFGGCFSPFNVASDDYRLILHVANTNANAWTMKIDNVKVGVKNTPRGPPVTDWQSYTPTITANGGTISATIEGKWRQVGDSSEIVIDYVYTSGTGSSGILAFSLPSGQTIDSTKRTSFQTLGSGYFARTSTGFLGTEVRRSTDTSVQFTLNSVNGFIQGTDADDAGAAISVTFKVPIQGWSSNTRLSDGYEGRDVAGGAARSSTAQTGVNPNNSGVKVQLNSLQITDSVGGWDLTNSRYNIKSSGLYSVSGSINVSGTNVLTNLYYASIYVNGSFVRDLDGVNATAGNGFFLNGSTILNLKAGDYVELFLFGLGNNSSSPMTLASSNLTRLSIFKIQSSQTIAASPVVALEASATNGTDAITSSLAVVKFTTKDTDTHNAYSTSTGLWIAPESGFYNVAWRLETNAVNLSTSQRFTSALYKNGAVYKAGLRSNGMGVSTIHASGLAVMGVRLNAGDTLAIYASSDVSTVLSTGAISCYFTVTKAGN